MNPESLEQLMGLHYPVRVEFDEQDKVFVAEFLDLPGCSASGETVEEAYQHAQEAKAEWLRVSLEQGLPIPKPSKAEEYSGRVLVRLPSSLHAMLSEKAKLHGASLNQYMVHLLSGAVVGDSLSVQLDELKSKIGQLEWRIANLTSTLGPLYSQQQPTYIVSTGFESQEYPKAAISGLGTLGQNLAWTPSSSGESVGQQLTDAIQILVGGEVSVGRREKGVRAR